MRDQDRDRNFIYALAFCLAYEQPGAAAFLKQWVMSETPVEGAEAAVLPFLRAAEWALGRGPDAEPELANEPLALVAGGATKIKGYVFESARLPEIRGASGLLDHINLYYLPTLWEELGCPECVIYANGGEILAFAPAKKGPGLADDIERLFTKHTLVGQSVAVSTEVTPRDLRQGLTARVSPDAKQEALGKLLGYPLRKQQAESDTGAFGEVVALPALGRFRRREGNPDASRHPAQRALPHFPTLPYTRRCASCDRRAAIVYARVGAEEGYPLCEACARKRVVGHLAKKRKRLPRWWDEAGFRWPPPLGEIEPWTAKFEQWLNQHPALLAAYYQRAAQEDVKTAADLGEIGEASKPTGYVGVVYADGNNMGGLLEALKTPGEYRDFSEQVYAAMQEAVYGTLAQYVRPHRLAAGGWVYPFEILGVGGDDVFLIVPAHLALRVACEIARRVEKELRDLPLFQTTTSYPWAQVQRCRPLEEREPQCKVSLSAGVVLAAAHTPVFSLQGLAQELLKSAKRGAKRLKRDQHYLGGTIDFLSLKSVTMIGGSVAAFRETALQESNRRLTARPYTLAETEALLESVALLKDGEFPKGQLYRLREALRAGLGRSMVDYFYFFSRSRKVSRLRQEIESRWQPDATRLLHPWRPCLEDGKLRETIWYDLVDLYDFVPESREGSKGDRDARDPD
jgi:CRISPR-associated protein Cmr2